MHVETIDDMAPVMGADGEFHAFNGSEVNRLWTLQRRNGGPWRISSRQSI